MYTKLFALLLSYLVYATSARPVIHEAAKDDIVAVGSFIREVRQLAPLKIAAEVGDLTSASNSPKSQDTKKRMRNASGKSDEGGYYRTYGSDAEGEKGYLKETYGKGDQGYKTLDTFHKQDGDKYEFETQTTYGKKHDDNEKTHKGKKEERDHEGAGTMVDKGYAGGEEDHEGEGSEYSHYTEDDDGDAYGSYHEEKEPEKEEESKSYSHNENYSDGDGDEESYEGHSSYNSGDDGEEDDHY